MYICMSANLIGERPFLVPCLLAWGGVATLSRAALASFSCSREAQPEAAGHALAQESGASVVRQSESEE